MSETIKNTDPNFIAPDYHGTQGAGGVYQKPAFLTPKEHDREVDFWEQSKHDADPATHLVVAKGSDPDAVTTEQPIQQSVEEFHQEPHDIDVTKQSTWIPKGTHQSGPPTAE